MQNISVQTVNAIRVLSAEAIEKAKSGHPGLPLGAAPVGYALYSDVMKYNPKNPDFYDRDRFVLSAGHGSMLLYSLLYLFGFGLKTEDLENFRQFGSKTPGHPEYGVTAGVETSTGPLGQGVATAVGMAMAETRMAAEFNKEGFPLTDHYTYVLCGDGCMQEGIENEAASFACTNKLGKLIVFYDSNNITIEGDTSSAFTENVGKRHEALGWQVINVADINDLAAIRRAVKKAKAETQKPSLIICKSVIGYGSPLAGKADCHGAPLGADNVKQLKAALGWEEEGFAVPQSVLRHTRRAISRGKKAETAWNEMFAEYKKAYPAEADAFEKRVKGEIYDFEKDESLYAFEKADATRSTGSAVLNRLAEKIPAFFGGSADLGPSNKSVMKNTGYYSPENRAGGNIHFGVREQAMAAISNGIALHGGFIAYCATFFVFSDYLKGSLRLSALMNLPVVYIMTHDSIGVGEDGPTHEPVEHLTALRATPNVRVFRPADGRETAAAWVSALSAKAPTCLVLSRQTLPLYEHSGKAALKGAYVLSDCEGTPDVLLLASGSEVQPCMEAQAMLKAENIKARVVSVPCMELFDKQDKQYRESVLPSSVRARVCVEAGSPDSWYKYAGLDGKIISMNSFGESAPAKVLFEHYGFTAANVAETAKSLVK
ncbi:MAG: transketolase [Bacillota bacterium]|nr:MAG: transketolase [Bacillota bacterium]